MCANKWHCANGCLTFNFVFPYDVTLGVIFAVCPGGWITIGETCYILLTNYASPNSDGNSEDIIPLTFDNAVSNCVEKGGLVATLDESQFASLKLYLELWRHGIEHGNIWLGGDLTTEDRSMIRVSIGGEGRGGTREGVQQQE